MKMHIGMVVPPWVKIPPEGYGGIELEVALLIDELAKLHKVTLFTVKSSKMNVEKYGIFDEEQRGILGTTPSTVLNVATTHTLYAYLKIAKIKNFTLVHDHTWKEGLLSACFLDIPVVHTIHGPINRENKQFYNLLINQKNIHFTVLSEYQKLCLPELKNVYTVHNSIDVKTYMFSKEKKDYLFYLGRFNEEKSPHIACETAKKLNKRLYLAGKISEKHEKEYFDKYIKPYLSDKIKYLGEISEKKKRELFRDAKCFLFPIQWDEPFGIVAIEALACGTPVVSFRRGAIPEIVENGVTGYLVDDVDAFVESVKLVDDIKPEKCRNTVECKFSAEVMTKNYISVYEKVIESMK